MGGVTDIGYQKCNIIAMLEKQQSSGVSPVIGIILMVAVTVGLVALASTIVFDLGNNVNEPADVSANLEYDKNDNKVRAELIRNENADRVFLRVAGNDEGDLADAEGETGSLSVDPAGTSGATETAELVAEVGETGNEQVIRTITYTI
jgi:flagellin-like protein